jgi:phosphoribosylglycinamide formyltransferase-1
MADVIGVFSDKPEPHPPCSSVPPEKLAGARDAAAISGSRLVSMPHWPMPWRPSRPDWVVCAGYMRILGEAFVAAVPRDAC